MMRGDNGLFKLAILAGLGCLAAAATAGEWDLKYTVSPAIPFDVVPLDEQHGLTVRSATNMHALVGDYMVGSERRAFSYRGSTGTFTSYWGPSWGYDIKANTNTDVVGSWLNSSSEFKPVWSRDGGAWVDLAPNRPFGSAHDINRMHEVLGTTDLNGKQIVTWWDGLSTGTPTLHDVGDYGYDFAQGNRWMSLGRILAFAGTFDTTWDLDMVIGHRDGTIASVLPDLGLDAYANSFTKKDDYSYIGGFIGEYNFGFDDRRAALWVGYGGAYSLYYDDLSLDAGIDDVEFWCDEDGPLPYGYAGVGAAGDRAYLWRLRPSEERVAPGLGGSELVGADLNTMIDPESGWVLMGATSVLEDGTIYGFGTFNGQFTSFRLSPVPEPATLAALGVGALALLARRRHLRMSR